MITKKESRRVDLTISEVPLTLRKIALHHFENICGVKLFISVNDRFCWTPYVLMFRTFFLKIWPYFGILYPFKQTLHAQTALLLRNRYFRLFQVALKYLYLFLVAAILNHPPARTVVCSVLTNSFNHTSEGSYHCEYVPAANPKKS